MNFGCFVVFVNKKSIFLKLQTLHRDFFNPKYVNRCIFISLHKVDFYLAQLICVSEDHEICFNCGNHNHVHFSSLATTPKWDITSNLYFLWARHPVSLVEQDLFTLLKHLTSRLFCGVPFASSLVLYVAFCSLGCLYVVFGLSMWCCQSQFQ